MKLMKQFKPNDWTVADQLTCKPDFINNALIFIQRCYVLMFSRRQNPPNQQGMQQPQQVQQPQQQQQQQTQQQQQQQIQMQMQQAQAQQTQPQLLHAQQAPSAANGRGTASPQTPNVPLNAVNLQQLEQQERARRGQSQNSIPPTAPTTRQPPYQIGAISPQGIPRAYGPHQVTKDNLVIPETKKRKMKRAANDSPVKTNKSPASKNQQLKATPPATTPVATTKNATPPAQVFRCKVSDCSQRFRGFPSQATLDQHIQETHSAEEPIENPLDYLLESVKAGLGVFKAANQPNGADTRAAPATAGPSSVAMKPSPSQQEKSSTLKSSASASKDKKEATAPTTSLEAPAATKDAWSDSPISREMIRTAFTDIGDETSCGLVTDPVDDVIAESLQALTDELFEAAPAKESSSGPRQQPPDDTPASASSAMMQTPRDGEIKDEEMGTDTDSWMPLDWDNLPDHLDDDMLTNDGWQSVNWDAMELNDNPTDSSSKLRPERPIYSI